MQIEYMNDTLKYALEQVIAFIRNKDNSLSDRYKCFKDNLEYLPVGRWISSWSFTDRNSEVYTILDNPFEHRNRGIARADFLIDCYIEDPLYEYAPRELIEKYGYDIPIEMLLECVPDDRREYFLKIIDILLGECLSGTAIDW